MLRHNYLARTCGCMHVAWSQDRRLTAMWGGSGIVTDKMLMAAAEAVPTVITPQDLALGCVYPRLSDIRHGPPSIFIFANQFCLICISLFSGYHHLQHQ